MKLTIISGRSGSGKSSVLHFLEDRGYYCIDNLPASLLPALAGRIAEADDDAANVAVSIDARNSSLDLERAPDIIEELGRRNLSTEIIFLDANSHTLLRRFTESRRKHPVSSETVGLTEAIDKESKLLEPLSARADLVIDTSDMSLQALRETIRRRIADGRDAGLELLFQSFGYKHGVPVDANIVYDVRCLPNPFWHAPLRSLTGLDKAVADFLEGERAVRDMYGDISRFLKRWVPSFEENNLSHLSVALGCTGGQHRSVYLCEKLCREFSADGARSQVRHRELGPEAGSPSW